MGTEARAGILCIRTGQQYQCPWRALLDNNNILQRQTICFRPSKLSLSGFVYQIWRTWIISFVQSICSMTQILSIHYLVFIILRIFIEIPFFRFVIVVAVFAVFAILLASNLVATDSIYITEIFSLAINNNRLCYKWDFIKFFRQFFFTIPFIFILLLLLICELICEFGIYAFNR